MQTLPTRGARVKAPAAPVPFFPASCEPTPILWTGPLGEELLAPVRKIPPHEMCVKWCTPASVDGKSPLVDSDAAAPETPATILRRARALEHDAALVLEVASTDPDDLDAQAVDLLQIVVGTLLHLVERARAEGRWLDAFSCEPEHDVTPFVRLMPARAKFAEVVDLAVVRARRELSKGGAS